MKRATKPATKKPAKPTATQDKPLPPWIMDANRMGIANKEELDRINAQSKVAVNTNDNKEPQ